MGTSDLGNINVSVLADGLPAVNIKHLDDDGYKYKTGYKTDSKSTVSGLTTHSIQRDPGTIGFNLPRDSDEYEALEFFINAWFELPKRPDIQILIKDSNNGKTITGIDMAPVGDHEGGRNSSADQGFDMQFAGVVKAIPLAA